MRLNKTELKLLIYRKVKSGIPYEQAFKEVKEEMEHLKNLTKALKEEKKDLNNFKTEFEKLQNGQK